jgi:hypothetical protein
VCALASGGGGGRGWFAEEDGDVPGKCSLLGSRGEGGKGSSVLNNCGECLRCVDARIINVGGEKIARSRIAAARRGSNTNNL